MQNWITTTGMVAAIVLPLWNIPLIVKIVQRRSSRDISLSWALGVWVCTLLMAPSAYVSPDAVWRTFYVINLVMFTGVVAVTLKYRKGAGFKETFGNIVSDGNGTSLRIKS